jgi:uncharacterized protein (TIGR02271 family)
LQFADGRIVRLPTAMLQAQTPDAPEPADAVQPGEITVVPLVEEQLQVSKQTVTTGRVRLQKSIGEYDVQLNEPLTVSMVHVERVPLGHVVEVAPGIRQEGETTIYPVLEERLVLTKELVLVEELHVTRQQSEFRDTRVVTLRRESMEVVRKEVEHA